MNNELAIEADVALYNVLFKNDFAPIVITVMGFRAEVRIDSPQKANTGGGAIRLKRTADGVDGLEEIGYVTDWLVSDDELWKGFLDYKLIETCIGVLGNPPYQE